MNEPTCLKVDQAQIDALLDRVEQRKLVEIDYPIIADTLRWTVWLSQKLEEHKITIHRLRKIFGFKTERTKNLFKKKKPKDGEIKPATEHSNNNNGDGESIETKNTADSDVEGSHNKNCGENTCTKSTADGDTEGSHNKNFGENAGTEDTADGDVEGSNNGNGEQGKPKKEKPKRKGKKYAAKDYKDAIITKISHNLLKPGCRCPDCQNGNLRQTKPGIVLRIIGQPWLQANIYELERLRCNTCGKTFTAKLPKDMAREPKFDNAAKAIVCLLKYRGGFPFYRQESLQTMLDTPISDSALWKMTRDVAMCLEPIFENLITEAARGECLHNDDTKAKILDLIGENKEHKEQKERTGIFTTAILSRLADCQIALFFTGRQHAGENLDNVLDCRPKEMPVPTQMCDASSNNSPDRNQTDEGNCIAHLRRKFFEIAEIWPTYALPVISFLNTIFRNGREAKEKGLDEAQTFEIHKTLSAPVLENLKSYCEGLIADKKTEPNSNLGKAINYMLNHWTGFTLFVRKPGVPLDNNADERLIKRAVLNRKNGLFFKTAFGAHVGDILLSVIETCQLNQINPYRYLIAVQTYADQVNAAPSLWLPWNYETTLSGLGLGPPEVNEFSRFEHENSPELAPSLLSA